jgi:hypothetical protein
MKKNVLMILGGVGLVVIVTVTVIMAQSMPYAGNYPTASAKDVGLNRACSNSNPCMELFVNGYHAEPNNVQPAAPGDPIVLSWRTEGVRDCYISRQSNLNNCSPRNATDCLQNPQRVNEDDSMNVTASTTGPTYYRLQCRLRSGWGSTYINHDIAFNAPTPPVVMNPLVITDTCPTCGDPQINFTINATPQVCS